VRVESDVTYIYTVVGVDAMGNEISLQGCYYDPPLAFVSCERAPIAHGTVSLGGPITPLQLVLGQSCMAALFPTGDGAVFRHWNCTPDVRGGRLLWSQRLCHGRRHVPSGTMYNRSWCDKLGDAEAAFPIGADIALHATGAGGGR
jgi:hypothetical protein